MNDQNQNKPLHDEERLNQLALQTALQDKLLGCLCRVVAKHPELSAQLEHELLAEVDDIARTHPESADLAEAYFAKLISPRVHE